MKQNNEIIKHILVAALEKSYDTFLYLLFCINFLIFNKNCNLIAGFQALKVSLFSLWFQRDFRSFTDIFKPFNYIYAKNMRRKNKLSTQIVFILPEAMLKPKSVKQKIQRQNCNTKSKLQNLCNRNKGVNYSCNLPSLPNETLFQ